jgi:hypothetical protein
MRCPVVGEEVSPKGNTGKVTVTICRAYIVRSGDIKRINGLLA